MLGSVRSRVLAAFFLLIAAATVLRADDAPNLSTLGRRPDWSELEKYQETMTHDRFVELINHVYCTHGFSPDMIKIDADSATILTDKTAKTFFKLRFARTNADAKPVVNPWTATKSLPPKNEAEPLSDLRIALDPGHLGGEWAKMEERWFQIGSEEPVREGDMTLLVARLLASRLQALGATVALVRDKAEPVTPNRPDDFKQIARDVLRRAGIEKPREDFDGPADPLREQTVRWQSELLFYRNSEIRRRANVVNFRLHPDLVLCLHFNAEPWGDPKNPTLVENNHVHLLVNGAYLQAELDYDDERHEMLEKLLSSAFIEESGLAEVLAGSLASTTELPPYHYKTENVTPLGKSGYIYARNLIATRLYRCPTLYLEPYVMNSRDVYQRIQAGDYEGTRKINGVVRPSIYREYVEAVANGLTEYYRATRK